MGRVFSSLAVRSVKNFNVENRAEKVISKQIPRSSPRHPTSQKYIESYIKEHPEALQAQKEVPTELLERLKSVKVVSEGTTTDMETSRQLPQERRAVDTPEYGYHEPQVVPRGKVTLRHALQFLTDHQEDKNKWNAESIAKEYNLDPTIVQQILKHFRAFRVYLPAQKLAMAEKTGKLSSETVKTISERITEGLYRKQLPSKDADKTDKQ